MQDQRPELAEIPEFYRGYVGQVSGGDLIGGLEHATERLGSILRRVPADRSKYRYAQGKWSIVEVLQHVIDSERIFAYRALRFARNDDTELPGFDENTYALASEGDLRELDDLLREHDLVRAGTMSMFRSFTPAMLERSGIANGKRISVRAIGWVIAGHAIHHATIIDQRYLDHGHT